MRKIFALALVILSLLLAPIVIFSAADSSQNTSPMQVRSLTISVTAGTTKSGSFLIANTGNIGWTIGHISTVSSDPSVNCTIAPLSYYPYVTYVPAGQSVKIEISVSADKSAPLADHSISIVFSAKQGPPLSQGAQQSFSGNVTIFVSAPTAVDYMPAFQLGFVIAEILVAYLIVSMFIKREGGWFDTRAEAPRVRISRPHFYRDKLMNFGRATCELGNRIMKKSLLEIRLFTQLGIRFTKNLVSKIH